MASIILDHLGSNALVCGTYWLDRAVLIEPFIGGTLQSTLYPTLVLTIPSSPRMQDIRQACEANKQHSTRLASNVGRVQAYAARPAAYEAELRSRTLQRRQASAPYRAAQAFAVLRVYADLKFFAACRASCDSAREAGVRAAAVAACILQSRTCTQAHDRAKAGVASACRSADESEAAGDTSESSDAGDDQGPAEGASPGRRMSHAPRVSFSKRKKKRRPKKNVINPEDLMVSGAVSPLIPAPGALEASIRNQYGLATSIDAQTAMFRRATNIKLDELVRDV